MARAWQLDTRNPEPSAVKGSKAKAATRDIPYGWPPQLGATTALGDLHVAAAKTASVSCHRRGSVVCTATVKTARTFRPTWWRCPAPRWRWSAPAPSPSLDLGCT
ncbi:MAG: hypothetical protein R2806_12060 [Saprospiraceae bacterium]